MLVTCLRGHPCESKIRTGGFLNSLLAEQFKNKQCSKCYTPIEVGQLRYVCNICKVNFCDKCAAGFLSGPAMGSGGARASVRAPSPPADVAAASSAPESSPPSASSCGREVCKYGVGCYNHSPEHRRRFSHPDVENEGHPGMRLACKYGDDCYRKDARHLEQFAHPGDRNYRMGLVVFKSGQRPQLKTLWDAFQFYDPDESGHLSQEEFSELLAGFVSGLNIETPTLENGGLRSCAHRLPQLPSLCGLDPGTSRFGVPARPRRAKRGDAAVQIPPRKRGREPLLLRGLR